MYGIYPDLNKSLKFGQLTVAWLNYAKQWQKILLNIVFAAKYQSQFVLLSLLCYLYAVYSIKNFTIVYQ